MEKLTYKFYYLPFCHTILKVFKNAILIVLLFPNQGRKMAEARDLGYKNIILSYYK
jgi:hypothetical protein